MVPGSKTKNGVVATKVTAEAAPATNRIGSRRGRVDHQLVTTTTPSRARNYRVDAARPTPAPTRRARTTVGRSTRRRQDQITSNVRNSPMLSVRTIRP